MKIFIAGGSGAIGIPLVRALIGAGHQVGVLTRSASKESALAALGAEVFVADALNHDALVAAVAAARPTHVVHQLTALPKDAPRRASALAPTNRLRVEGTKNLLDAAIQAGARRFVVGSFAILARRTEAPVDPRDAAAAAVDSMESQVLAASRSGTIEGIVLRYGMFYGPGTPSTDAMVAMVKKRLLPITRGDSGRLPLIQIDDAVAATVAALDAGRPGGVYEIVEDEAVSMSEIAEALAEYTGAAPPRRVPAWLPRLVAPLMARMAAFRTPISNVKARAELGWRPKYPTLREGLAQMFRRAA